MARLLRLHPWSWVLPWSFRSGRDVRDNTRRQIQIEQRQADLESRLVIQETREAHLLHLASGRFYNQTHDTGCRMLNQNDFLPESLTGWTGLLIQSITLLGMATALAVRYVRGPLETRIQSLVGHVDSKMQEHGTRIGRVETHCAENDVKINEVDRSSERLHLEFMTMNKAVERVEVQIAHLLGEVRANHERYLGDSRRNGERLARIDATLHLAEPREHM